MSIYKKLAVVSLSAATSLGTIVSALPAMPVAAATTVLQNVVSVAAGEDGNVVNITFNDGLKGRITFLEDGIFRYNVDPAGEFSAYAKPRTSTHTARIQQYPDDSENYSHPEATVSESDTEFVITAGTTHVIFDKATAKMTVKKGEKTVLSEKEALTVDSTTYQTLNASETADFYGGGTQNGRFVHTGEVISIANTNNWVDGGVASPNPFYWSTEGYGVLRNTFSQGSYDFGNSEEGTVTTGHGEKEFDAYYFVSDKTDKSLVAQDILQDYFHVTGNPVLLPEYGFYLGHLNCYNRDGWSNESGSKAWRIKYGDSADSEGEVRYESGMASGYVIPSSLSAETLNGEKPTVNAQNFKAKDTPAEFSARAVVDRYYDNDMPFGWFLPNDGYGCGYGQNGYEVNGGTEAERTASVDANAANLGRFTEYAESKGVRTGLWTQSNLTPIASEKQQLQRDFRKEVTIGGISTLKTDVAWVGSGYSFGLNGLKQAYDIVTTEANTRPNIITLAGWAGTQRYGSIWSGDQYGGNWEYIRFHIPTFVGQSLAGNPNAGSDMDGIFGGAPIIATRDYQWKTFTTTMLDMDGWGSYVKSPYTHGDPYTGISRMYLKLKAQLMPYIYTTAASAANIDTNNGDTGLPMTRAMMLVDDSDYAASKNTQYQYMFGDALLTAPVYQNTAADDKGNDIRNDIFLPGDENDIWIDYFTGDQYRGGQVLNGFDAPLWKLPLFVRNGAIIPMYEENNNPDAVTETNPNGLDKTKRIIEFYPAGSTSYTLYEDDGISVTNTQTQDDEYGAIDSISYNGNVLTEITSVVDENAGTATLTAKKSTGTYEGYDSNRTTKFTVNVSKEPAKVEANGAELTKTASLEAFNALGENESGWFYDAAPEMNKYSGEEGFADTHIINSPKVYVKFARTDVAANDQTAVIYGFENTQEGNGNELVESLGVPAAEVSAKTSTSITISWPEVEGATSYDVLADGVLNHIVDGTSYIQSDLAYDSAHTYQVRARNGQGYSAWSDVIDTRTELDPWRNVPTPQNVSWSGQIYGSHNADLAFDHIFQSGDGGFHSKYGGVNDVMVIDYGKIYKWDKLEYYPRDDAGNGTVTKMDIAYSMDGTNWTELPQQTWARDASMKTANLGVAARYIRLIPRESVGTFFAASEIAIYKQDGTNGWALGSNTMRDEVSDGDYSNMKNYLGVENKEPTASTFQSQIAEHYADMNNNGVYDVYDYSFTMAALDGGTTKTGRIGGNLFWSASSDSAEVKAGDTVTVTLYGANVANANALGGLFRYSTEDFEYVQPAGTTGVTKSGYLAMMEDLSINKVFSDGTGTVNVAAANRGDQPLYNGSGALASFKLKARKDGVSVNEDQVTILVGPTGDSVQGVTSHDVEIPNVPAQGDFLMKQNEFTITMTNDAYPTDDGTNVSKLIQQGNYNGLFNGVNDPGDRSFELLWSNNSKYDEEKVKVPLTLNFALNTPENIKDVKLFTGATGSNGRIISHSATATFSDGTTQTWEYNNVTQTTYPYEVSAENADKLMTNMAITITETGGAQPNHNLTLSEIEFTAVRGVAVDDITINSDVPTKISVGDLVPVEATVSPSEALNTYYTVESSDESVAAITAVQTEDAINWYVKGVGTGTAAITVTAAGDTTKFKTFELTVSDEIDVTELVALIAKAEKYPEDLLTASSWQALSAKLAEAKALLGTSYTREDVVTMTYELESVLGSLSFRAPIAEQKLDNSKVSVTGVSSECTAASGLEGSDGAEAIHTLDGDDATYWHSNWAYNVGMPQWIVYDLGADYSLTDVSFLPRSTGYNGDIFTVEILIGSDPENLVSAGTFDFERASNGYQLKDRTSWHAMTFPAMTGRFVKFNVLHSGGDTANDAFCSMAEVAFYGEKKGSDVTVGANKTLLNRAIAYAEAQKADASYNNVNDIVKAKFEAALDAAKAAAASEEATQDEVNAAWMELTEMIHYLGFTSNKAALADLVAAAQDIYDNIADYEGDLDAFKAAYEHAKEVLESDTALDASIEEARQALEDAMAGVSRKEVVLDKALLEYLVGTCSEIEPLLSEKYIEAGQAEFLEELTKARDVLVHATTQAEIDNAVSDLGRAYLNLRLKADESILKELQSFLAESANIDRSKFTPEQLEDIDDVRARVTDALNKHYERNPELAADDAAALHAETQRVLALIRGDNSQISPAPGTNTGTGNGTSNNVSSAAGTSSTADSRAAGNKTSSSVKTAAATSMGAFTALFAAAGAALTALKRRKNK